MKEERLELANEPFGFCIERIYHKTNDGDVLFEARRWACV